MRVFLASLMLVLASSVGVAATVSTEAKVPAGEALHLTAGPGLLFYRDYGMGFMFGAGVGARISSTAPLYLGADVGVGFLGDVASPFSPSVNNTGATTIQLLPTIYYRANVAGLSNVRTYLGLSVGPNIFIQSFPAGTLTSNSETKVYFQLMLRAGADIAVSRQVSLLLEPKLGILRSAFLFNPQFSVVVGL